MSLSTCVHACPPFHGFFQSPFERMSLKMEDLSGGGGHVLKKLLRAGSGPTVPEGALVRVHYNGYLEFAEEPYDSSRLRNQQCQFTLGKGTCTVRIYHRLAHFWLRSCRLALLCCVARCLSDCYKPVKYVQMYLFVMPRFCGMCTCVVAELSLVKFTFHVCCTVVYTCTTGTISHFRYAILRSSYVVSSDV